MRVHITDHAYKRWREYTGVQQKRRNLAIAIKRRLYHELRNGLHMDKTGAVHMPFRYHLVAVLTLENTSWTVVTFHNNDYGYADQGITAAERKEG